MLCIVQGLIHRPERYRKSRGYLGEMGKTSKDFNQKGDIFKGPF